MRKIHSLLAVMAVALTSIALSPSAKAASGYNDVVFSGWVYDSKGYGVKGATVTINVQYAGGPSGGVSASGTTSSMQGGFGAYSVHFTPGSGANQLPSGVTNGTARVTSVLCFLCDMQYGGIWDAASGIFTPGEYYDMSETIMSYP